MLSGAALLPLSLRGSSQECVPQAATPLAWTTSAGKSGCGRGPGWGPGPRSRPGDATVSLCKLGQAVASLGPVYAESWAGSVTSRAARGLRPLPAALPGPGPG